MTDVGLDLGCIATILGFGKPCGSGDRKLGRRAGQSFLDSLATCRRQGWVCSS